MSGQDVRIGMVGLGGWGKNVVRNFASANHCRLTHICDAFQETLDAHRSLFPGALATTQFDHLLDDASVDAVAIATPAPMHYGMVKQALLAGKHVYVEKPMTLTAAHAEDLVSISERMNRKLMVGHLLEYHPAINVMKDAMQSGMLGDVYYMYCQRLNLGVVRRDENAFWSLAPHDVSVILYLLDQEPCEVTANGQCFLQPGVEDVVFANLRFPQGQIANIHVSWLDPHKQRSMVLVGSEKMLVFDDMQPSEKIRIYDKGARTAEAAVEAMQAISVRHGDIVIPHISGPEPLKVETQHFVDSIRNDTTPRSDGRDGLRVVRILEQVEQQLKSRLDQAWSKAA
ncbi:MAG: Gfo/Idh/MocA family oxidoreductase [Planctomycetota bacterium]|nr:Gfo/Idh/MocA family oxidoreductase [Planctomycetota bacterium]